MFISISFWETGDYYEQHRYVIWLGWCLKYINAIEIKYLKQLVPYNVYKSLQAGVIPWKGMMQKLRVKTKMLINLQQWQVCHWLYLLLVYP